MKWQISTPEKFEAATKAHRPRDPQIVEIIQAIKDGHGPIQLTELKNTNSANTTIRNAAIEAGIRVKIFKDKTEASSLWVVLKKDEDEEEED